MEIIIIINCWYKFQLWTYFALNKDPVWTGSSQWPTSQSNNLLISDSSLIQRTVNRGWGGGGGRGRGRVYALRRALWLDAGRSRPLAIGRGARRSRTVVAASRAIRRARAGQAGRLVTDCLESVWNGSNGTWSLTPLRLQDTHARAETGRLFLFF